MFFLFKKKTLPKRLTLLCALPYNRASFMACCESPESDFGFSLKSQYQTDDLEELWNSYRPQAKRLEALMDRIESLGGTVKRSFILNDLSLLAESDVAIILAHHSNCSDELEIAGKLVRTKLFVNSIPLGCRLYLDITSCYSSYLIPWIKARIPESKIVGIDIHTPLNLRIQILDKIISNILRHPNDDYLESFKQAWGEIALSQYEEKSGALLGNKLTSSAYAPKEVRKGDDFIVSVFLYKSDDEEEVEIRARNIDDSAEKRNELSLRTKLKKGDLVEFQYQVIGNQNKKILVDEEVKALLWESAIESIEFFISVDDEYPKSSIVSKIRLFVNKELQGDMCFKINISTNQVIGAVPSAPIDFLQHDKYKEALEYKTNLLEQLRTKKNELAKQSSQTDVTSSVELQMCSKLEELLSASRSPYPNKPKIVFISSTADMIDYRRIMRDAVESCEMYPDMYENWGQGNDYPRDMCCKHVLECDIFVCILGVRYGYVEPIWNKSMTEIEYRTAVSAGIPTLLYVVDNYKEEIQKLHDLHEAEHVNRQLDLIEELAKNRLVHMFKSVLDLQINSYKDLLHLKYSM